MRGPKLTVEDLGAARAGAEVVRGVTFQVNPGEVVALLGPNGAGKSTTIDAISGLAKKTTGRVQYGDQDITHSRAHEISRMGLLQVAQERELFPDMTVGENVLLGTHASRRRDTDDEKAIEDVRQLFPRLANRWAQRAGSLSGGEQQMLAIGRALTGSPSALLLDEPSSGLAPVIVQDLVSSLIKLADRGLTLLLVEQNVGVALAVANRIVVMRRGEVVFSGKAEELGDRPMNAISEMYV